MSFDKRRQELRREINAAIPESPGVYVWLGAQGEKLYVGKSRNLRRRMLSYLTPSAGRIDARQRHLSYSINSFAWRRAEGELLALLLEDALIKQYEPRHNDRQRDYRERRYLLLTDDPFPACLCVDAVAPRPGRLFGPYKDEYFVAELIDFLCDSFELRACPDRDPFRRSARYDLGRCAGPCRDAISVAEYADRVAQASAFLDGDETWLRARLAGQMHRAADELRFEEAASLRERLAFTQRFCARQRFLARFGEGPSSITERRYGLTYRFERGSVDAITRDSGAAVPVPDELSARLEDRRFVLDRANVIHDWCGRTGADLTPLVGERSTR